MAAEDPELEEFLKVMQPRSKSAVWANDTIERQSKAPVRKSKSQPAEKHAQPETVEPEAAQPPAKRAKKAKRSNAEEAIDGNGEEHVVQKKKRKKRPLLGERTLLSC